MSAGLSRRDAAHRRVALVADDSTAVRALVSARLQREGFEVREVDNGLDALRQIGEEPPDLLVVDDVLPGLSGVELVEALTAHADGSVAVAYLVEFRSGWRRAALAGLSERSVIVKPFDLDELAERVTELVR